MRPALRTPAAFIAFSVALAFFVRVWFAHDAVFGGSFVRFAENDPWYHMRLVENLLVNFPHRLAYDPYLLFGSGQNVAVAPLFDLLIATIALVAGLGSPTPWLVEHIGAYLPAVLGALCVLPAYGLGQILFSTRAALFAAGLTAILPGQFLARSSLGFTDHHIAEVLLSACTLLFLARAFDEREEHSVAWRRSQSIVGGLFLGLYLLAWGGGMLLVVVIASAVIAALVLDRNAQIASRVSSIVGITFIVAAIVIAPFLVSWSVAANQLAVLAAAGLPMLLLAAARSAIDQRGHSRWIMLMLIVTVIVTAIFVGERVAPDSARLIYSYLWRLHASAGPRVGEALPLFASPVPGVLLLFYEFGVGFYLAFVAAVFLARAIDTSRLLLLAMFAAALVLMINQVRFSYYLAVPVAVLAGYACDRLVTFAGRRQELAFVVVVLVVFVPSAQLVRIYAASNSGPGDDWHEALTWLRANSPEPLEDPRAFDRDYAGMSETHAYPLPASAYGVIAAWDRGYWITRIAHRIPSANPTQAGASRVANVFLARDETTAMAAVDKLRAPYVIVDPEWTARLTPRENMITGGLPDAIATLGVDSGNYYEVFDQQLADGTVDSVLLYYPAYYQTLAIRLTAFGGGTVRPQRLSVAVFHQQAGGSGSRLMLDELRSFASADAADDFIRAAPDSRRLVGTDPFESCVPLEALTTLSPIHRSLPEGTVRIFERRH